MELSTRYSPEETESKWYQHWMDKQYFRSVPDEREPYSIVIPPPNVTGVLHMGHMLNNTIQDILIRKARLDGKNACWVPGTDHASIATEAKVVRMLREKGITKGDIGREEFLKHAFAWKEEYGGIILEQLKRLGASCDWDRTRFTMEPKLSDAVIKVFVDLYRKGRVYRRLRMTNWDPEALTVLSNEEVLYSEENAQLFHLRYDAADGSDQHIIIATQRPETIMADVAIAVHPEDERYASLIGKEVLIPLINRPIPVIADSYVDKEFGTGALKITPAHDPNDYEIGQRHKLEVIDILNADGTLNEKAQILIGEDRFEARKKIKKLLQESGNLIQLEDYVTKIGRSERTSAVVEPRLTLQWFVDMKEMSRVARHAVESDQVTFWPSQFWNMYYNWLREDNVRDWCISRQLWWGHRIPAWYYQDHVFVGETAEEALEMARRETGKPDLQIADLAQDEDVLDTWFSSWLWPMSVFDGFETPEDLKYYYPTSVLVTGWDIIYLWVARMVMAGYEWSGDLLGLDHVLKSGRQPFKDVYFTGMVRDNKRRKMSKSLGNSPEALKLLDTYGADGVRFAMLSSAAAGNDIIFDAPFDSETKMIINESKLCEQGRNYCNKMWNALRLIRGWEQAETAVDESTALINQLAGAWLENKMESLIQNLEGLFLEYRLSEALIELYKFIWDDFCSWYLEMIKPAYGRPIDRPTFEKAISLFEKQMILLHPFMPFVTEEIWHNLKERAEGEDCIVSRWPEAVAANGTLIDQIEQAKTVVSSIRDIRNSKGIKMKDELEVYVQGSPKAKTLLDVPGWREMVIKMGNLSGLSATQGEVANSISFLAGTETFFVVMDQAIDTEAECIRLKEELAYYQGFLKQVNGKLSNAGFVSNAPAKVVEMERKKQADGEAKLKSIEESLQQLGCL
jgi:valyl-tRNA synthetase